MTDEKMGPTTEAAGPVEDNRSREKRPHAGVDPTIPLRFRDAEFLRWREVMGPEWIGRLAHWMDANRPLFTPAGNGDGRFNWELVDIAKHYDVSELAKAIHSRLDQATQVVTCDPFECGTVEMHLSIYAHGNFFNMHDDSYSPGGDLIDSRKITFCYYFAAGPKVFSGGQLEFQSGERFEPEPDSLVMFNPYQLHSVRPVECYSPNLLDARLSLVGWVHARQQKRHYRWNQEAIDRGACTAPGGLFTSWPQDVDCEDCARDIVEIMRPHCFSSPSTC